jgi:hypothetical protein
MNSISSPQKNCGNSIASYTVFRFLGNTETGFRDLLYLVAVSSFEKGGLVCRASGMSLFDQSNKYNQKVDNYTNQLLCIQL